MIYNCLDTPLLVSLVVVRRWDFVKRSMSGEPPPRGRHVQVRAASPVRRSMLRRFGCHRPGSDEASSDQPSSGVSTAESSGSVPSGKTVMESSTKHRCPVGSALVGDVSLPLRCRSAQAIETRTRDGYSDRRPRLRGVERSPKSD